MIPYNESRKCHILSNYSSTVKDSNRTETTKMSEELKATMQEAPVFEKPRIEEGLFECECVEVKKIADGKFGARVAVICDIAGQSVQLAKVSYMNLTPKSAATDMILSFGCEFMPGNDFNFGELVGKKARAMVEDYTGTDGVVASTISKFKALK
jgi:hypothetical protein